MKFVFFFVIFIIGLNQINGECNLQFEHDKSPIFIPLKGTELLLFYPDYLVFGNNNYINAVCPSGFQEFKYKKPEEYYESTYKGFDKVMFLRCLNGQIQIEMDKRFLPLTTPMSCINSDKSEIFEGAVNENCNKKVYKINLNMRNLSLDFADVCFDLENMRIEYLHYVTKKFKSISYQQFEYTEDLQHLTKTEAPEELFFIDEHLTNHLISDIIGYRIEFKYAEFYPLDYWNHISDPLKNGKTLNRFLGWTNFIEGNWKFFRNLLAIRSNQFKYDVYLGTSGVIVAPVNADCNKLKELQIEVFNKRITTIPKYVWTYLKSREYESDEFVVIGVNSPYFEFFRRNETIFCDDICDEIEWLKPLKKFRKLSTFGYMFCCRKEQVEYILDGFPQNTRKFAMTTSTTMEPIETIEPVYDEDEDDFIEPPNYDF